MSQVKADDYVNSAGTGAPKFSKGIDLSQAAGYNKYATVAKSGDYTVTTTDGVETILVTAASNVTITLPAASGSTGRKLTFKKVDSGTGYVAIVRAGSDTIDGATTRYIPKQYDYMTIESDGTTWHIILDKRRIHAEIRWNANATLTKATYATFTSQSSITSDAIGMWTTTGRFVIKDSGTYQFTLSLLHEIVWSSGSPPTFIENVGLVYLNASLSMEYVDSRTTSGNTGTCYIQSTLSYTKDLSLNDYIEPQTRIDWTGGSGVLARYGIGAAYSFMSLTKI